VYCVACLYYIVWAPGETAEKVRKATQVHLPPRKYRHWIMRIYFAVRTRRRGCQKKRCRCPASQPPLILFHNRVFGSVRRYCTAKVTDERHRHRAGACVYTVCFIAADIVYIYTNERFTARRQTRRPRIGPPVYLQVVEGEGGLRYNKSYFYILYACR